MVEFAPTKLTKLQSQHKGSPTMATQATQGSQSPTSQAAETAVAVQTNKPQFQADSIQAELLKKDNIVTFKVPEKNMLGWDHPGFGLNLQHYGPGTHSVNQLVGEELERRKEIYNQSLLSLLQPQ